MINIQVPKHTMLAWESRVHGEEKTKKKKAGLKVTDNCYSFHFSNTKEATLQYNILFVSLSAKIRFCASQRTVSYCIYRIVKDFKKDRTRTFMILFCFFNHLAVN